MTPPLDLPFDEPEDAPPALPDAPPRRRVLTVSELTAQVRGLLESRFMEVWVEGEISNSRIWNTGHMYFTLKDTGAQIRGVMFRSALRALRFAPKDGLRVVARGHLSLYEPKGEYQIVCEHLEPEGLGALQLAFDQLKERLSAEGLFDASRKRPLPALPRKIGVVTSLDGAAIRDIVHVLRRRYPNAHIVIRPARVQGEGAAREIAAAIRGICRVPAVDVVIVGRGGGSIEDLWAFNEEIVARAIASCPVPTISAVGHETDVTIADFVADLRAPTPSAAAEIVVARRDDFEARIDRLSHRVRAVMQTRLHRSEARLRMLEARPGLAGFTGRMALRAREADELDYTLRQAIRAHVAACGRTAESWRRTLETFDLRRRLARVRARLVAANGRLTTSSATTRHRADRRLRGAAARLEALSPLAVLGRGYAVCWNADRTTVIRTADAVSAGEHVRITLAQGELECAITGRRDTETQRLEE